MSKDSEQDFEGADKSDTGPPRRGPSPYGARAAVQARSAPSIRSSSPSARRSRAMADGTLDSQVGTRICNGLGIMRACLETQKLEQLESRMDEIADRVAHERGRALRARDQSPAPFVLTVCWPRSRPKSCRPRGRAGTLFILTRSLRQKREACPTRLYPGF